MKNKKVEDALENNEEVNNVDETLEEAEINEDKEFEDEVSSPELCDVKALKKENESLKEELSSLKDRFLRLTAEYDNYRKRTTREKENIYLDACEDVLKEMFPVLDNLERALNASGSEEDLRKGIEMTVKQFNTSFEKLGVEEIATDMEFDPNFHNAVMHVEDENLGKNQVAEVFLKGYKKGNKVLRYSMVKVAN
ncbi:MAG: nucleotide exchange factor GrpE [Clostridium argentinense]|uniref:nucleotide exchange factor GrpE n=1 Tax=uncultured Clostridium sp. TaxID=59620 RepID=UPI001A9B3E72|nr:MULTISPECIES: nucleotide exchange factor GrpE [Clostridium]MDU1348339.1 nucleotide exchange factor GrpE [Clostridium argentinense]